MTQGIFELRKVTEEDRQLLFEWANDPAVRENAFGMDQITKEEHDQWFRKVIRNPSIVMYVLMLNDIPIGQCRLTVEGGIADIDYSVDRRFRGQGIGKILLNLIEREVIEHHMEIRALSGRVKSGNRPSVKCFKDNGYEKSYLVFEKQIK